MTWLMAEMSVNILTGSFHRAMEIADWSMQIQGIIIQPGFFLIVSVIDF
jgi:hypothetical protein